MVVFEQVVSTRRGTSQIDFNAVEDVYQFLKLQTV